ncbi:MAG: alpha-L-fucosidase [Bacteroides sp.]|nr:alpha-L-fucosidase [Bacteroides sp.]
MKNTTLAILCLLLTFQLNGQFSGGGEAYPDLKTNQESLDNFIDMRFGMFIHWGPVSLRGTEIGWSRGREIPIPEYDELYKEFNPELFNAAEWVGAAKMAGMKYLVITTRHHDGFSLWDSQYTDYDMGSTPYGKGVLKALSEECSKQGILFGTYYSICDWYRPDYPVVYPDPDYSFNEERSMDSATQVQFNQYLGFMINQMDELINEFSTSIIWFDGEWEWAWTHELGMKTYAYLRGVKPELLINNRVDKGRQGMEDKVRDPAFAGDFATPEQQIGAFDNEFAWETCMTIGEQWAWKPKDKLKSAKECIHTLARTIGGDGNLLFNVGPMPDGRIEQRQLDILEEMGQWVSTNQEAIYGSRGGPFLPSEQMVSTHKDKNIYLFLLEEPDAELNLNLEKAIKLKKAYFLSDNSKLKFKRDGESIKIQLPSRPSEEDTRVIVLELKQDASEIEPFAL